MKTTKLLPIQPTEAILRSAFLAAIYAAYAIAAAGQQNIPPETVAQNIPGVVAGGAKVRVIKSGFKGIEGPLALPDGSMLFTEPPTSRVMKIDIHDNISVFLENTNGSNALGFDPKGRLISVQTTAGHTQVGVIFPKGSETVLANNFEGKPLTRPNDLVVDRKGGVYFTDFNSTREPNPGAVLGPAVYYIAPGGKITRITDSVARPNGIQLSPDEKILYVNDSKGSYLMAFDIEADGAARNGRRFAKYDGVEQSAEGIVNGVDGMAVDSEGRVYSTVNSGIQVFSPQGKSLGIIPLPDKAQNVAFGGADKKTLYVFGHGAVMKIQMLAQGFKGRPK